VISAVIVNYKSKDYLRRCLRALLNETEDGQVEVFVVDNASGDGSVEMVKKEFPGIHLIEAAENLGFSKANNLALRRCTGDKMVLLNPDAEVRPGCLQRMADFLDSEPAAGAVGPKLTGADGMEQKSGREFPTPLRWFLAQTGLADRLSGNSAADDEIREVDWVSGACLMIRAKALEEVGLFDERFFMYSDEVDFCYRLKQSGWKVYHLPSAEAIHYGSISATACGRRDFSRGLLYSSYVTSRLAFFKKHYGPRQTLLARGMMLFAYGFSLAKLPLSILRRKRGKEWYGEELRICLIGLRMMIWPSRRSEAPRGAGK
jgi:GT2 family glycosyltransferase